MTHEATQTTPNQEKLAQEGWSKRFTAGEPELSEYVRMYEELGLEVRVEAFAPDEEGNQACSSCFLSCDKYRTIYTRPGKGQ